MGAYLKLDYNTTSTNKGLKKAITYIGKYNGKYAYKEGLKNSEYLKGGIKYVAKKFGRLRGNAIRSMIYAKNIKATGNKRWCFNKQTYVKAYHFIVKTLLKCQGGNREEVILLLKNLYNEAKQVDDGAEKVCSNALIFWQMKMLNINSLNSNKNVASESENIYNSIKKYDKPIPEE